MAPGQWGSVWLFHSCHIVPKCLMRSSPIILFFKYPIKTIFTRFNFIKVVLCVRKCIDVITIFPFTKCRMTTVIPNSDDMVRSSFALENTAF